MTALIFILHQKGQSAVGRSFVKQSYEDLVDDYQGPLQIWSWSRGVGQ